MQSSSLAKIQAAAVTQMKQFNESVVALEENNEQLNGEIQKVNEKIDENKEKFNALSALRKQEVDRQLEDLLVVQGTAIDRYNDSILGNLEKGIASGKEGFNASWNECGTSLIMKKCRRRKKKWQRKLKRKRAGKLQI